MKNKRDLRLATNLSLGCKMCSEEFFSSDLSPGQCKVVSELFQKFTFANLCKPIHNVIIIPVSSDPLNLETVERKEKNLRKI